MAQRRTWASARVARIASRSNTISAGSPSPSRTVCGLSFHSSGATKPGVPTVPVMGCGGEGGGPGQQRSRSSGYRTASQQGSIRPLCAAAALAPGTTRSCMDPTQLTMCTCVSPTRATLLAVLPYLVFVVQRRHAQVYELDAEGPPLRLAHLHGPLEHNVLGLGERTGRDGCSRVRWASKPCGQRRAVWVAACQEPAWRTCGLVGL